MKSHEYFLFSVYCTHFCMLYVLIFKTVVRYFEYELKSLFNAQYFWFNESQYQELFPPGVKCLRYEAQHSPSPIPEVKNACRHSFTPLYAFMACRTAAFLSI